MNVKAGESVFENADEVLMDKIIDHTEKNSDAEEISMDPDENEFSDTDTHNIHSFTPKKSAKKYKVLLVIFLCIGVTLFVLKALFHKNQTR